MKHLKEANRYLDNAWEILNGKAQKENGYYKGRKSVEWYKEELGKMDKKILTHFNSAYNTLHLLMGYDGESNADVSSIGLKEAEKFINWAEQKKALPQ
ncbi:DUF5618 family protein [Parasediminibacterium sp. JCM 36343]|uniref:DUF5618 family protein n=1 Tax=Parasediminibacterium sp. JCM 36343 TaxID=3374279 RepID=UPI00397AFDAC